MMARGHLGTQSEIAGKRIEWVTQKRNIFPQKHAATHNNQRNAHHAERCHRPETSDLRPLVSVGWGLFDGVDGILLLLLIAVMFGVPMLFCVCVCTYFGHHHLRVRIEVEVKVERV